jgi:hypothetical protein
MRKPVTIRSLRAAVVFMLLLVVSCSPDCEIERSRDFPSATRQHVATVFIENCHATAPYVTAISLRCAGCKFDADEYVAAFEGTPQVAVEWQGDGKLLILHTPAKVYRQANVWNDVQVTYDVRNSNALPASLLAPADAE